MRGCVKLTEETDRGVVRRDPTRALNRSLARYLVTCSLLLPRPPGTADSATWAKKDDVSSSRAFRRYEAQRQLAELRACGDAVAKRVLDHRETPSGREYLVRWSTKEMDPGTHYTDLDTWEPAKEIIGGRAHGTYLLKLMDDPTGASSLWCRGTGLFTGVRSSLCHHGVTTCYTVASQRVCLMQDHLGPPLY